MKPWEETWGFAATGCHDGSHRGDDLTYCVAFGHGDEEVARARLAAAAPDMARLLLALEVVGDDGPGFCPACGRLRPDEPHKDDCRWVAVLRKAGVR
jgi:hypothetical protein